MGEQVFDVLKKIEKDKSSWSSESPSGRIAVEEKKEIDETNES